MVRVAINDKGQEWGLEECPVKMLRNHIIGISSISVAGGGGGGGLGVESLADF